MPEVSKSQTLRNNERLKHLATALTAWSNAAVIAGIAKQGLELEIQLYASLWIAGGLFGILMSSLTLTMLQAEGEL